MPNEPVTIDTTAIILITFDSPSTASAVVRCLVRNGCSIDGNESTGKMNRIAFEERIRIETKFLTEGRT